MRDFLSEYVNGAEDLLAFYATPAPDIGDRPTESRDWDPALAEAIREFHSSRGGEPNFLGNEVVVITGQQPGIFTGPLYTIYKAVTTILVAKKLEQRTGAATVPVFWIGSEDHDFEEAATTYFLTKQHEPMTVRYEPEGPVDDLPMHALSVDGSLHEAIDRAAAETSGSEFRSEITEMLHETLDAADSLADWTTRLLVRLFRDTPLIFFAPHLPEARRVSAEIIRKEISDPLKVTALLNDAAEELEKLDFDPQVIKSPKEACFFLDVDGCRRKVTFENGQYCVPDAELNYTPEELVALLDESPERFSPNVALRCIVQQHLFPAAAYVAGPSELAYWAQLKPVFDHFELPMPVVYPRARCTLTTIKLNKLMKKFGLAVPDLAQHQDALLDTAIRHTSTNPALAIEKDHRERLEQDLKTMAEDLANDAPTAASMTEALLAEVEGKFDRIERAIVRSDEDKNEATRKQMQRLCNSLAPQRKPQERVYNVFSYLFEQGWGLIPRLMDEIDVESFDMTEIEL